MQVLVVLELCVPCYSFGCVCHRRPKAQKPLKSSLLISYIYVALLYEIRKMLTLSLLGFWSVA
jgi:hypothetical protein